MTKPILPKLSATSRISSVRHGRWEVDEDIKGKFRDLSEALETDQQISDSDEVDSIPDIWARCLLFEMALYDPHHLLHDRILGEWRGLLAILALRDFRGLARLSTEAVSIKASLSGGLPGGKGDGPALVDVLARLLPDKTLAGDTSWDTLYVITFGEQPIGVTSPTTLVCTASSYLGRILSHEVSWFDGRFLTDPCDKLREDEKRALAGWLVQLRMNLADHLGKKGSPEEFNSLLANLRAFIESLGGQPDSHISISDRGLGMDAGVFRYLDKPVACERSGSNVELVPSPARSPARRLLVVDKDLSTKWSVRDCDIVVFGALTMANLPFSGFGIERRTFGKHPLPDGVEIRLPDDFFTERLVVIDQEGAFPGAVQVHGASHMKINGKVVTPILPLRKELLDYFTIDDLCGGLRLETGPDGIKVFLRLTLCGTDGRHRDTEISHEYAAASDITVLQNVPVLVIWPNFIRSAEDSRWKAYYTYYDSGGHGGTFYAQPYAAGGQSRKSYITGSHGAIEQEWTQTDSLPQAMVCREGSARESEPIGVVPVAQPQSVAVRGTSLKIGVDFGTSGTNVYATEETGAPERVVFQNRLLQVSAPGSILANICDRFIPDNRFFPEKLQSVSCFLSLFHDLRPSSNRQQVRPLLDGHIYFLNDWKDFVASADGMVTDLKWGGAEERILAKAFFEQLCLQCSAEAACRGVTNVSWRFSYPTAFPSKRVEEYEATWGDVVRECNARTGLTSEECIAISESVATARFFRDSPVSSAAFTRGVVCIDIGGGTSDISVWQGPDKTLLFHTSLRLAGRDIFLEPLRRRPDFLHVFGIDTSCLDGHLFKSKSAFYAQVDAIISNEWHKIAPLLPTHAPKAVVKEFVDLLALGIGGLLYYAGLLIRNLVRDGRYDARCEDRERLPDIYIGGNGSLILHWLASGQFTSTRTVNILLKKLMEDACDLQDNSQAWAICVSPKPKAEAAFGLVVDEKLPGHTELGGSPSGFMAGESLVVGDGRQDTWRDMISEKSITDGVRVHPKLPMLKGFLNTYNSRAHDTEISRVTVGEAVLGTIADTVNQLLSDLRGKEEGTLVVEPPFILALKRLMEMRADEWANRNNGTSL